MTLTTEQHTSSASAANPLLAAGFVVYLTLLAWVVLWKLGTPRIGDAGAGVIKIVPFLPSGGAGASEPTELAINLVLFVPFGLYLGLLAPSWPWRRIAATVAGASLALEITQYVLAVGSADTSDIIVNTTGGLLGFGALAVARRRHGARATAVLTAACATMTVLAVVAAALFVASPVRLDGPPPGVPGAERPAHPPP